MIKKAQSTIEFIIIIIAVLFGFIVIFFVFQQRLSDKMKEQQNLAVRDIAIRVQREISLAVEARDGYQRTFYLPSKALSKDYSVMLTGDMIFVNTTEDQEAISLPIQNVTGFVQKGSNIIRKENGRIYLNG